MNLLPVCLICEEVPSEGLRAGVFINKKFICDDCEEEMATIAPGDENYEHIVAKIKILWDDNNLDKNALKGFKLKL